MVEITKLENYSKDLKKDKNSLSKIYCYLITEFDDDFKQSLKDNEYLEYFSTKGSILWRYKTLNKDTMDEFSCIINVMRVESMVHDAEARNSTFLSILKNSTAKL